MRLVTPDPSTGNSETLSDLMFLLLLLGNTLTCGMKLCQAYYKLVQTYFPSPNCMPRKICSSFQTTVFCVFNLLLSAIHLGMNRLAVWWLGHSSDISPYITKNALPNICHYEATSPIMLWQQTRVSVAEIIMDDFTKILNMWQWLDRGWV